MTPDTSPPPAIPCSTPLTTAPPEDAARTDRILSQFMQTHISLVAVAESLGMSLAQLTEWSSHADNWRALAALANLGDMHVRMTVGRYRVTAAAHLLGIATGRNDSTELARRACADLLDASINTVSEPAPENPSNHAATTRDRRTSKGWPVGVAPVLSPPTEDQILRTLEALGRDAFAPAEQSNSTSNHIPVCG